MAILVHYNYEIHTPPEENQLIPFLEKLIKEENFTPGNINIIYTDNTEILTLNKKYLQHNYFTDVITFDYNEKDILHGDIFISLDKVAENAQDYDTSFYNECLRVVIHGILHLAGYNDSSESERNAMRTREDHYLEKYSLEK